MRFRTRAILALAAFLPAVGTASAQHPTEGGPRIWVSASAGTITFPHLNYLNIGSRDDIDTGTLLGGTVEVDLGKVGGIGVSVATSELGLNYVSGTLGSPCRSLTGCETSVQITQILATLHVGGGRGFDMLYEASGGFTHFSKIALPAPDESAPPAANDFTGVLGLGAAYGFTDALSIFVVGDLGFTFHKDQSGEGVEADNYSNSLGLRGGVRYGLWSRPR